MQVLELAVDQQRCEQVGCFESAMGTEVLSAALLVSWHCGSCADCMHRILPLLSAASLFCAEVVHYVTCKMGSVRDLLCILTPFPSLLPGAF